MAKNRLLVITRNQDEYRRRLEALGLPELEILAPQTDADMRSALARATIMLANPPLAKEYINVAKGVVWVQSTYAGIDALNAEGLRKDYVLTNIREVYGPPLAEYVFAYILAFRRDLFENLAYQREAKWAQRVSTMLHGETLCIAGAGSIGTEIARVGKAFGMRVLGLRTKEAPAEHFDAIYTAERFSEFLAEGDYVVSVLPNTSRTTDMFDAKAFAAMKRSAVFINVGRGNAVVEDDLVAALERGVIAKAVLDVCKKEPLPPESLLWRTKNAFLTPHMSGYVFTDREFEIFKENYLRFCRGEELLYRVDLEKGY